MSYEKQELKYKVLANRRRLAIIAYLDKKTKATVGQIAEHIHLSFKATSKHLQILKNAGLVANQQVRLKQYYFLVRKHKYLKQILASL